MKQRGIVTPDMPLAELHVVHAAKKRVSSAPQGLADDDSASMLAGQKVSSEWLMIPLSKLKIHPFNSRARRSQARIEEVRDMLISSNTQREAITVVPGRKQEDAGFYYILSGQTRYHAANLAGWNELKSQINWDIDPDDHLSFFAASVEHNTVRSETDWDLAIKVKALVENGCDPKDVQKAIRRDERGMRRLVAMMDLPESILTIVRENPTKISGSFCEALRAGLTELGEDAMMLLAKQIVDEDLSHRALVDTIERAKRSKLKKATSRSTRSKRDYYCQVVLSSDQKAGEFKVMPSREEGKRRFLLDVNLADSLSKAFLDDIELVIAKLGKSPI